MTHCHREQVLIEEDEVHALLQKLAGKYGKAFSDMAWVLIFPTLYLVS